MNRPTLRERLRAWLERVGDRIDDGTGMGPQFCPTCGNYAPRRNMRAEEKARQKFKELIYWLIAFALLLVLFNALSSRRLSSTSKGTDPMMVEQHRSRIAESKAKIGPMRRQLKTGEWVTVLSHDGGKTWEEVEAGGE